MPIDTSGLDDLLRDPNEKWMEFQGKMAFDSATRAEFYKMLASMLTNNLALSAAIQRMHDIYAPQGNPLAVVLRKWSQGMVSGMKFSEAIAKHVPESEMVLISAGERSNNLADGLMQAAFVIETKSAMKSAVVGSLAKPAFLMVLVFVILAGFSVWMAPTFQETFPADKFPPHVQTLFKVADFVRGYWHVTLVGIAGFIFFIGWTLNNWTADSRNKFDNFPPWSIFRIYNSASFMIALSSFLRAGVSLTEAIKSIRAQSGPWMKRHLSRVMFRLEAGDAYKDVFNSNMLDLQTRNMVAIYADLTDFGQAIDAIGKAAIKNATTGIQKKAAIGNVIVLALVAAMIGWIYMAVMSVQQMTKDLANDTKSAQAPSFISEPVAYGIPDTHVITISNHQHS